MFALVDCNNFYVSCERVFNPNLNGKAVVVLSNNDGCIISRSEEAKSLGLKMGEPIFKQQKFIEQKKVFLFSSNYSLYGDMSQRVMECLSQFSPFYEIYSIDECFLDLSSIKSEDFIKYAKNIAKTTTKNTGIPVSIGIGRTKTLAKIANKIAKKNKDYKGIYILDNLREEDAAIRNTPIEDIWGIGRQHTKMLKAINIHSAYDFIKLPDLWIRKNMTIMGLRIKKELLGNSCIPIETIMPPKKAIATTRAFGKKITDFTYIKEAVSTYATRCSEKLRKQKSIANTITVFIHTDPFKENETYISRSKTLSLPIATNSQLELVKYAIIALKKIFINGYRYKKAGVIVDGIIQDTIIQTKLFDDTNQEKHQKIMKVFDSVNAQHGKDTLKLAVQGKGNEWKLRQEKLSPSYTTKWEDIIKINAKK